MNNSPSKDTVLRRLRAGDHRRLDSSPALTRVLTQHSAEVWGVLATQGQPETLDWAWNEGVRFSEADGRTFLVQTLLQQKGDALFDVANWWRDHGATLPPSPPPSPEPVLERQLTTDSLWRRVIDANPEAITWLAAQELPVRFERPEAGSLVSHAVLRHKLDALPVIDRLLEAGADLAAQDNQGENACHALARLHVEKDQEGVYADLWKRLIEAGAAPSVANHAGETALDLLTPSQRASVEALERASQAAALDVDIGAAGRRMRNRRT
jgi:hypothetical protein